MKTLKDAIKITKDKKVSLIEMYNIGNLYDLAVLDMIKIIQNKCLIKKCGHCGFYFTPEGRIDAIYCNREIYPTKKLCSDVGSIIKHKQKAASDEGLAYFQLIYKRNSSRVGNRKISSKTFREWSKIARDAREKYKDGEIAIDEFKEILGE